MSLHPQSEYPIPEETRRIARAAFPKGTLGIRIADALGTVYCDSQFADLFPRRGQPAEAPARLALATVLQFLEGLSDRQAADAVRGRIDWKYALALELSDPGFDHTVLSEFRTRLLEGTAELRLLDLLLERLRALDLLKARGRQRTDSTHVLAAVRVLNRLERVGETLRAALNELAIVAPDWLRGIAPPEWYERYGHRVENYRLPRGEAARSEYASVIAADGQRLLAAVDAAELSWIREVPAVGVLRRSWQEQYVEREGKLVWRDKEEMASPAELVHSPYDPEARYSRKRDIEWIGYKVQLTETCDPERPHLIVNVETTPATTPDDNMLEVVHASLEKRDLLPSKHLVDKGYTDSEVLVRSERDYGVSITGPVADDPSWQARAAEGFEHSQFRVDWDRRVVTCPQGKESFSFLPSTSLKNGRAWEARFSREDCTPCPYRSQCTRAKKEPRIIGLLARDQYEALQAARRRQETEEFREQYAARAGIEATHEQAIRRCGLRHARYIGMTKVHLQHVITAAAINLVRLADWLEGKTPAQTRRSAFARLQFAAA
jgi:transposase